MNLQVIISGDGWVLDKYGKILADGCGGVVRTEPAQVGSDGITYFMNYAQSRKLTQGQASGVVVSMLTHHEEQMHGIWDYALFVSDALVPMSEATLAQAHESGRNKSTVIPLPVRDIFTKRRPRIGIAACRNAGNEHRKGWDFVDRLIAEHPEWDIVTTGGELADDEMVAWYRSLDLYLCASRYEGGPMGLIEALALGVPTVTPRGVGWCDEYGVYQYNAGDYQDMARMLRLVVDSEYRGYCNWSEADYIAAHVDLFATLTP